MPSRFLPSSLRMDVSSHSTAALEAGGGTGLLLQTRPPLLPVPNDAQCRLFGGGARVASGTAFGCLFSAVFQKNGPGNRKVLYSKKKTADLARGGGLFFVLRGLHSRNRTGFFALGLNREPARPPTGALRIGESPGTIRGEPAGQSLFRLQYATKKKKERSSTRSVGRVPIGRNLSAPGRVHRRCLPAQP